MSKSAIVGLFDAKTVVCSVLLLAAIFYTLSVTVSPSSVTNSSVIEVIKPRFGVITSIERGPLITVPVKHSNPRDTHINFYKAKSEDGAEYEFIEDSLTPKYQMGEKVKLSSRWVKIERRRFGT